MLSYSEKALKILLDSYEFYREKLKNSKIFENFKQILSKLKKTARQSGLFKELVDELETKISNYTKESFEEKIAFKGRKRCKNRKDFVVSDSEEELEVQSRVWLRKKKKDDYFY